ncbi:MAG: hypothetical protein QOJ60_335, partial [Actinomycetota bacterium]|nr:hypothetical protein [Actinomycetota bacterium]
PEHPDLVVNGAGDIDDEVANLLDLLVEHH